MYMLLRIETSSAYRIAKSRYLYSIDAGTQTYPGRASSGQPVKRRAQVCFRFKACVPGLVAKVEDYTMVCDNVVTRKRVPLPPGRGASWTRSNTAMGIA